MRIVLVTDQYPPSIIGGVATTTSNLARDLTRRGHEVWVIAPSHTHRTTITNEDGVTVHRFSSVKWPFYEGLRLALLPIGPISKVIRAVNPDVVHLHSPIILGSIGRLISNSFGHPVVATNHYMPINISATLTTDPYLGRTFEAICYSYLITFYNHCSFVTAPTATALNLLQENGLAAPCMPVSNGINLDKYQPGAKDKALLERLSLPTDRPLAILVSRLFPEKQIDVLIKAMQSIKSPLHLVLAGTGHEEEKLRELAHELDVEDKVSFTGYVNDEDLVPLYRSCDMFTIPSIAELQSLATMEAMACGLPVVAADAFALPELVKDGYNGFLTEPLNAEDMARAIENLLNNPDLRQEMGKNSLQIIKNHERTKIIDQWEQLYAKLAVMPQKQSRKIWSLSQQREKRRTKEKPQHKTFSLSSRKSDKQKPFQSAASK